MKYVDYEAFSGYGKPPEEISYPYKEEYCTDRKVNIISLAQCHIDIKDEIFITSSSYPFPEAQSKSHYLCNAVRNIHHRMQMAVASK